MKIYVSLSAKKFSVSDIPPMLPRDVYSLVKCTSATNPAFAKLVDDQGGNLKETWDHYTNSAKKLGVKLTDCYVVDDTNTKHVKTGFAPKPVSVLITIRNAEKLYTLLPVKDANGNLYIEKSDYPEDM